MPGELSRRLARKFARVAPALTAGVAALLRNRPIADRAWRDVRKLAVLSCGQPWRFGHSFRTGVAVAPPRAGTDLIVPCYRARCGHGGPARSRATDPGRRGV